MRDGLLSIGELACMKGVGVKSLRYYESIGIFRPAFVDPSSGYRYYSLNQLMDLDAITTCIELGIPLKELRDYIEPSGMLDLASLLEHGRCRALARIAEAQAVLAQVSAQLDEINEQRAFSESGGPYSRAIEGRLVLCQRWDGDTFDVRRYARWMSGAYAMAKQLGVVPSYLQGFLFDPAEGFEEGGDAQETIGLCREGGALGARGAKAPDACSDVNAFAYLEVLPVSGSSVRDDGAAGKERGAVAEGCGAVAEGRCDVAVQDLPEGHGGPAANETFVREVSGGVFSGRRLIGSSLAACFDEAFAIARRACVRAVATEVWDAHLDPSTYVVEMLVACG